MKKEILFVKWLLGIGEGGGRGKNYSGNGKEDAKRDFHH